MLWTELSPWDASDAEARARQLSVWHGRFLSEPVAADSPEVDRLEALWQAAGGSEDPARAWELVVEALLRHPRALLY